MDLRILNKVGNYFIQQEGIMLNVLLGSSIGIMSIVTIVGSTVVVVGWSLYMVLKANKHE
jgi:hypothetical protein